ncbi:MAG TPA: bifunctional diaminohydroxyphosphoribosylaminopyrimidine deaminase/5-amino-6-(5-phosphoribosylamino)uracil reductase RibD [Candidatus Polarisedimenticolia bacterium]|jgi:diaminohydroxyphosphoribosylaminopyrimidine deaminase/5-amino-6-(5-phosphoribosylamino)uracil reductase
MERCSASSEHERYLRICLDLARRAEGRTSPNPMVGAVLVKGGRILARAFHRRAGAPHAEVEALRRAGGSARGATLYVNLEPCCHYGRTPPCVDAILAAGVRRVVACHLDPFDLVRGRGVASLRRAGVEVIVGTLRRDAMRLNERYLVSVTRGRPFVIVKVAMTLDGRIATARGESKWISSASSRRAAHRLRASCDAIVVGINTARADDPLLTARGVRVSRQPLRVVIDSRLRLDPRARMMRSMLRGQGGRVILYAGRSAPRARAERLAGAGAEVMLQARAGAKVDLRAVLQDLGRRGVTCALIEGGGELIASALEARVVDKLCCFIAPLILGGGSVPVVGGRGASRLKDAFNLERMSVRRVGPDLLVEGYPAGGGA